MSELFSRLGLRTAVVGGALALLLGACGEPAQEGGDQQQGSISPDSGQSSTMLETDEASETEQN